MEVHQTRYFHVFWEDEELKWLVFQAEAVKETPAQNIYIFVKHAGIGKENIWAEVASLFALSLYHT